uniref:Papilin a, proteoglycan-like sulfated glycoprotein n=1 Tax=Seriola lalandi dorsalis TaxID=1841481 RepID=A0A3B4XQI0_SERLL
GPYGECSRSCGSGDCPEGSKDFREEQCSQFDGTDFQGKRYKWLPYYGGENPCELNCMPRGENFFYRHRSSVVDGTPCHPGRRDVCVEGVCKRLGCDNMLESPQQEDPCLQCGGNGQSCHQLCLTFISGYNQMFIIPVGATTIRIRETVATRNYLAIKNLRGEYYLNGHWVIEFSRATPIAGTMLYYQRGAEGDNVPETIIGRGPTTEPLVVELISQEPNQGVEYEYYLPNGRSRDGYYWSFGSWSACSRECGSGYQSRLVFCTIDNEAYPDYLCASLPRPQTNRTCNPHTCPQTRSWRTGEWNACSVTCGGGSQVRSVQCVSQDASGPRVVDDAICATYNEAPPSMQTCNMQKCVIKSVLLCAQCSVTCGSGEQTRDVTCVGSGGMRLEETSCSALLRPLAVRPCEMAACPRQISWQVGEWGLCSTSCGSGSRERQVICSDPERNLFPVDQCGARPKPSTVERCNTQPCYSPQVVPSVQDPRGHDSSQTGFQPQAPDHTAGQSPSPWSRCHLFIRESKDPMCELFCFVSSRLSGARLHVQRVNSPPLLGFISVHRPETDPTQTNTVHDPHGSAPALHCSQSYYGCCPDGRTSAAGPRGLGCPQGPAAAPAQPSCIQTRYPAPSCHYTAVTEVTHGVCLSLLWRDGSNQGLFCITYDRSNDQAEVEVFLEMSKLHIFCYFRHKRSEQNVLLYGCCQDAVTAAQGPNKEGCVEFVAPTPTRSICSLPRAAGSCSTWVSRYHYDVITSRCVHFWYGGCHGNTNNFLTRAECQRACRVPPLRGPRLEQAPRLEEGPEQEGPPLEGRQVGSRATWGGFSRSREVRPAAPADRPRAPPHTDSSSSFSSLHSSLPLFSNFPPVSPSFLLSFLPSFIPSFLPSLCPCIPSCLLSLTLGGVTIDKTDPSTVEALVGQTVVLPCRVSPPPSSTVTVEWRRDGIPLSTHRHHQQPNGSLLAGPLTKGDSGWFLCVATRERERDHRYIYLSVSADLKITTAPNNIQVSEGSTALLPCVVSGENINIGWSRNGVPVRPDGRNIQMSSDGSLILNNVKPSDEGTYTCNAYTGIYSVSATAEVRIIKDTQQGVDVPPECVDQPELANCELIVYARLCSNSYYSSFCCASCTRHSQKNERFGRLG